MAKGYKRNRAQDFAISLLRSHSGVSCRDSGEFSGGISAPAITVRCKEHSKVLARDKGLLGKMERIEKQILNN